MASIHALAIALCALPSLWASAAPSVWSDSDRPGDLVYFGLYGGVSFASASRIVHTLESGGQASTDHVTAPVSFTSGYQMTFWPYEFVGMDMSFEVFGLPLGLAGDRFDASPTHRLRAVSYDGFGMQWGPTFRLGVPLGVIQPNAGVGFMLPVTFSDTQDPRSRLNELAFEVGAGGRVVGGVNVYVSRAVRLYGEYQLNYRFGTIYPGVPIDVQGLLRHAVVVGFMIGPEGYRKLRTSDKAFPVTLPWIAPAVAWVGSAFVKADAGEGEDP